MTNNKIKSVIKGTGNFLVAFFNIISCIAAVFSCIAAYTVVSEIISLKIEITPVVEKFQKDSIIIIRVPVQEPTIDDNGQKPSEALPEPTVQPGPGDTVSEVEINSIRLDRDNFWKQMREKSPSMR